MGWRRPPIQPMSRAVPFRDSKRCDGGSICPVPRRVSAVSARRSRQISGSAHSNPPRQFCGKSASSAFVWLGRDVRSVVHELAKGYVEQVTSTTMLCAPALPCRDLLHGACVLSWIDVGLIQIHSVEMNERGRISAHMQQTCLLMRVLTSVFLSGKGACRTSICSR